ncbi:MAG: hypothetical protein DRI69_00570 [Bacteroidetes bacterium]|nr:MAG: hypothetical protein DRI69_00570 [Bacteroidota bacterium]
MTASPSKPKKDSKPLPLWTKILPWVILISTAVVLFFVVQKGCVSNVLQADPDETVTSGQSDYPSQGVHDITVALEKSSTKDREFVLDGITFLQASGLLEASSMPALQQLLTMMKNHPTAHIRLEGYCRMQENTKANLRVSHQRAAAVANFLEAKGIDAGRLRTVGRGDSRRRTTGASSQSASQSALLGLYVERI